MKKTRSLRSRSQHNYANHCSLKLHAVCSFVFSRLKHSGQYISVYHEISFPVPLSLHFCLSFQLVFPFFSSPYILFSVSLQVCLSLKQTQSILNDCSPESLTPNHDEVDLELARFKQEEIVQRPRSPSFLSNLLFCSFPRTLIMFPVEWHCRPFTIYFP